ncbi:MAG: hypothetical protein KIT84_40885 [Labilithrix sp.]|nr:hypothetical protein [Labilithrix sp.]MCW5817426.1 hypothetical protein [Labilithrix sp.]
MSSTGVDVPVRSLGLCDDAGVSAAAVQALYFEPGNRAVPSLSALATVTLEIALEPTPPGPSADAGTSDTADAGCAAQGHAPPGSLGLLLATAFAVALGRARRGYK